MSAGFRRPTIGHLTTSDATSAINPVKKSLLAIALLGPYVSGDYRPDSDLPGAGKFSCSNKARVRLLGVISAVREKMPPSSIEAARAGTYPEERPLVASRRQCCLGRDISQAIARARSRSRKQGVDPREKPRHLAKLDLETGCRRSPLARVRIGSARIGARRESRDHWR